MFALPGGYRPANGKVLVMPVACDCKIGTAQPDTGRLEVFGGGFGALDGVVEMVTTQTAATGAIYLDGVSFRADG